MKSMSEFPSLIGLIGLMGSGKDAVADELFLIGDYKKASFADALRDEVADLIQSGRIPDGYPPDAAKLLPLFRNDIDAVWRKPTDPNMRVILQKHGTEYRRAQDPHYWERIALEERVLPDRVVFTDVRFKTEAEAIRRAGGVLWFVDRKVRDGCHEEHVSEEFARVEGREFADDVINNNGSLNDLTWEIIRALERRQ